MLDFAGVTEVFSWLIFSCTLYPRKKNETETLKKIQSKESVFSLQLLQ